MDKDNLTFVEMLDLEGARRDRPAAIGEAVTSTAPKSTAMGTCGTLCARTTTPKSRYSHQGRERRRRAMAPTETSRHASKAMARVGARRPGGPDDRQRPREPPAAAGHCSTPRDAVLATAVHTSTRAAASILTYLLRT